MNIYVGNLQYDATEEQLREAFEEFGEVETIKIITDKYSGRSKGFGFVEMPNDEEANGAITGLNGKDFAGRTLRVNMARPREPRPSYNGGGGGGGRW
ncbi:MAG: RNA-binding protein [Candidatus Thermoplasmatota archaeon]|jgi:RNA recognition motif-containing protein|nr:RNA-binding protein [Candidatus Thermoplasmatota archaeon]